MKSKISFLILLLLIVFQSVNAQKLAFRLGAKVGANATKIDGQRFEDGFGLSYHAGFFSEIDFGKKIGIQPELLWSQSSTRAASFSSIGTLPGILPMSDVKLNYLQIPVLLRYSPASVITLLAGPQFSILTNPNENLLQNGEKAFTSGDFAMVLGTQINLKAFRIYGRYNIGLANINDFTQTERWQQQQIQMGIGLKF